MGTIPQAAYPRRQALEMSVVVPLYNEQENIGELYNRLTASLQALQISYEIILVNDGSKDSTGDMINDLRRKDSRVVAVHLTRNFGHQPAVCAGLDASEGNCVVVMDGDLQDPPEVLKDFLELRKQGYEVVYAVRRRRKEGVLKRLAYFTFYRLMRAISDLEIPLDSGDFCLMDRRVVEALKQLPERVRFVRGLRTFVGFRQIGLCYERAARVAGEPKYTFRALVRLAVDGLISFSSYPLHLVTYLGIAAASIAVLLSVWVLVDALYNFKTPRGWASTMIVVLFMGAIQLISLGIMGEYVRRIFLECKGRPTYLVREIARQEADSAATHRNGSEPNPERHPAGADALAVGLHRGGS
jgi:glycosyltransferase involved in cell wall biosynthesis